MRRQDTVFNRNQCAPIGNYLMAPGQIDRLNAKEKAKKITSQETLAS